MSELNNLSDLQYNINVINNIKTLSDLESAISCEPVQWNGHKIALLANNPLPMNAMKSLATQMMMFNKVTPQQLETLSGAQLKIKNGVASLQMTDKNGAVTTYKDTTGQFKKQVDALLISMKLVFNKNVQEETHSESTQQFQGTSTQATSTVRDKTQRESTKGAERANPRPSLNSEASQVAKKAEDQRAEEKREAQKQKSEKEIHKHERIRQDEIKKREL